MLTKRNKDSFRVSIIIPCFNNLDLLKSYLPFVIRSFENPTNLIEEVILVDDGSKDGSAVFVEKNYPQIKLIRHTINRGFSSAVNTGARFSKTRYLVLLNTDVAPQEDFLRSPIQLFKNDDLLFGVSFNEGVYGWTKGIFKDGFIMHEPGVKAESSHSTFWISGGSGMFRRDIWMQLGGMDEKILAPFYWEDVDLSYRALKRGYHLLWDPAAKVRHEHEGTIKNLDKGYTRRIQERNQLLFIWKNLTSKRLFNKHCQFLIKRMLKHPGYIRIFFMALGKIFLVLKTRKKERKETTVSDETIFAAFK